MSKRKIKRIIKWVGIVAVLIAAAIAYFRNDLFPNDVQGTGEWNYVDFIDCGQGDSTLFISSGAVALMDASTASEADEIIDHLTDKKIKAIDHFILSHPHEDHIGGAIDILEKFEVKNIYMMRPTEGTEPTTSVYINLLKKIKSLGKKISTVSVGDKIECGDFKMEILGPVASYSDLNHQSIILRAKYEKTSFLITGDQEIPAEKDLVNYYGRNLRSTVLRTGHHGSETASGAEFLEAVNPRYAIISCGEGNRYGHPHKELLERLKAADTKTYRTDMDGDIIFKTDGKNIEVEVENQ